MCSRLVLLWVGVLVLVMCVVCWVGVVLFVNVLIDVV